MNRPSWDDYFLGLAVAVAARADCTRGRYGAVVVRADNTVASVGYNGSHSGGPSCLAGECPRGLLSESECPSLSSYDSGPSPCHALHAEMNALAFAREDTTDYRIFVTGRPCLGCVKTMRAHKLHSAVWPGGYLRLREENT